MNKEIKEDLGTEIREWCFSYKNHCPPWSSILGFIVRDRKAQKQELREKIERLNVGTLGGSIIIPRKDINQLLK